MQQSLSQNDAIEMLAQHIITKPVFDALFEGYAFTSKNPVSQSMQKIMDILEAQALDKEHETLEGFYASVRERASGITDPKGRQKIIVELYDKFFKTAFPRMVERLGIVYTPVEIVDFILHSADAALQEHFGIRLADKNVHILDPFTGTGTFPVRLIETGLIPADKLPYKYRHELHANEIVLLAYYIAAINIEESFHRVTGQDYEPFPGIVLTDTFQMSEPQNGDIDEGLPENHERADRQKARDIRVIVGNPPYSVGQDDAGDNNQNLRYALLDGRIGATYAAHSSATNKNSLYNSYIRAFRWASDRIKDEGIIGFVTDGGWIDGNSTDGLRKTFVDEFSDIYIFNLRGNARSQGELRRKEAGNVFESGSRSTVAVTFLVKRKGHVGNSKVHYHDIGDYLSREQKLDIVSGFVSHKAIPWKVLKPNAHHDWINQRSGDFGEFVAINDEPGAIFAMRSRGVSTGRDAWAYNLSKAGVTANMKRMVAFYNEQVKAVGQRCKDAGKEADKTAAALASQDSKKIKWNRGLLSSLARARAIPFDESRVRLSAYRPFNKAWMYFDSLLNDMVYRMPALYPHDDCDNIAICLPGTGEDRPFSALVTRNLPNLHLLHGGQCFPLHWYEKAGEQAAQAGLSFDEPKGKTEVNGYVKHDGITDEALANFRQHYKNKAITKEAIFYYVYGVLHSQEYRDQYGADLKKVLPRIPFTSDFAAFEKAGRALAKLHLDYETVEPWPVTEEAKDKGDLNDLAYYRVEKMRFLSKGGREKDKTAIVFNSRITIKGIPLEAYDYMVNGKSAIEWVMDRYEASTDKDSGIKNDPYEWCKEINDPAYVLNLLKRVIRVSMETVEIVSKLPSIG